MEQQLTEQEIDLARKRLIENLESPTEEPCNYTAHEINWIESAKSWEECKSKNLNEMSHFVRLFFLAHAKDKIRGKPQLIHQTIQRIPLLKKSKRLR